MIHGVIAPTPKLRDRIAMSGAARTPYMTHRARCCSADRSWGVISARTYRATFRAKIIANVRQLNRWPTHENPARVPLGRAGPRDPPEMQVRRSWGLFLSTYSRRQHL